MTANKLKATGNEDGSILVVGADGTIGRRLASAFKQEGQLVWESTRNQSSVREKSVFIDLSKDIDTCLLPVASVRAAVICAAVTSIEHCNRDPTATRRINVENTIALSKRLVDAGVFVIFLSSNAVFDGLMEFPTADTATNPQTEYGRQKTETEDHLLKLGSRIAVVRFSKILTPDLPLLTNWVRDLKAGRAIHPFADSVMSPISATFAATVITHIARRQIQGITQVSATTDISYEFAARYLATKMTVNIKLVEPISYRDVGILFSPKHTTLDSSRLAELGLNAPAPKHALDELKFDARN